MNHILVVDDEREIADVIELYLKNDQYEVLKFYTGEEALACIETTKIDLALLDVMLPDIDGFTILKKDQGEVQFPGDHADGKDRVYRQDYRTDTRSGRLHRKAV